MRVIVTRPASEAGEWVTALQSQGFDAVAFPLIDIAAVDESAPLRAAVASMATRRAAMFVSGNAVRGWFALQPRGSTWPEGARAWATGNGTRDALVAAGVPASLIDSPAADAPQFDSEALWHVVAAQVKPHDSVLIVRGAQADGTVTGRDWLAAQLESVGVAVDIVASYVRKPPSDTALPEGAASAVWLFSSSQAIANLVALAPGVRWSAARAVTTHSRIAATARAAGFGVVCESRPGQAPVIAALKSLQ